MDAQEPLLLHIPEDVERLIEERLILKDDVLKAIRKAEGGGAKFVNTANGRSLTPYRPKTVTYWVEYSRSGDRYLVHSAYSHRMGMKTGGGLTDGANSVSDAQWICHACQVPLELQTVRLQYMQCIFPLDLPACPRCKSILISEELATGKMAEAEQALEDK